MTERPIIMSAASVHEIFADRKFQARQLLKDDEKALALLGKYSGWTWTSSSGGYGGACVAVAGGTLSVPLRCPYGTVGDRLWVKETWDYFGGNEYLYQQDPGAVIFRADARPQDTQRAWRSPLCMPRWASRLTLEIVQVRVQRLQEISENDARAEGVEPYTPPSGHISPDQRVPGPGFDRCRLGDQPHRLPFADRWDAINGSRRRREYLQLGDPGYTAARPWRTVTDTSAQWSANPWIWALTFRRLP